MQCMLLTSKHQARHRVPQTPMDTFQSLAIAAPRGVDSRPCLPALQTFLEFHRRTSLVEADQGRLTGRVQSLFDLPRLVNARHSRRRGRVR